GSRVGLASPEGREAEPSRRAQEEEDVIMVRRLVLLFVALTFAWASTAAAQGKPDFSGTWKFATSEPSGYKGSAGWGVPSATLVIKQSASELTIESADQYGAPMR